MQKTIGFLVLLSMIMVSAPVFAEEATTTNSSTTTVASTTPVVTSVSIEQAKYEAEKKALELRKAEIKKELDQKREALKKQQQVVKSVKASTTQTWKQARAEYNTKYEAAKKVRNEAIKKAQTEKQTALKVLKTTFNASSSKIYADRTNNVNQAWKAYQESLKSSTSSVKELKKHRNDLVNKAWSDAKTHRSQLNATQAAQIKAINVKFNTAVKAAQDKFKTDTTTLKAELDAKKKTILGK